MLLVDGGDTFSDDLLGNLTRGEAVIRLMNAVGYQFMALGNHDFDYGFERTSEISRIARFPMRGANIVERATGQPVFGDPTLSATVGGVHVGLLALGYHNTHLTGDRDNTRALAFTSGIEAARRLVSELRRRAEAVVVVSHQGAKVDRKLLEEVDGIDLVVGAHSHDLIAPPERVGGGFLVQALSDGAMLGEVTLSLRDGRVVAAEGIVHALWAGDLLGLSTEIVGVQAAGAPSYARSLAAGRPTATAQARTFADGVATRMPDAQAFEIIRTGAARIVLVDDDAIAEAIRAYWTDTHNLAEGAGAAALAALIQEREHMAGRRVAVTLSGGNIDFDVFQARVAAPVAVTIRKAEDA